MLADARATHLDGVRDAFLQHLGHEDMQRLAAVWERVLPGSTET